MKLHILTVGQPKLSYAKAGWEEYTQRLRRYHTIRLTHVHDKWGYDAPYLLQAVGTAYTVALVVDGRQFTSPELAAFLDKQSLAAKEICFLIGGPEGLPQACIERANLRLGLSRLTFPHDLAMVVLAEALYRASTIQTGQPYHK